MGYTESFFYDGTILLQNLNIRRHIYAILLSTIFNVLGDWSVLNFRWIDHDFLYQYMYYRL